MKNELLEFAIKEGLEELVMQRFKNIKELKDFLKVNFEDFIVELVERDMTDISDTIDWSFVGSLQNMDLDILCDFDIYYAKTRANEIYITEVGYEFE